MAQPTPDPTAPPPSPEYLAETISYRIYIGGGICMAVSTIFFACRVASRFITGTGFRISDGILLGGLLTFYANVSIYICSAHIGVGRHAVALLMDDPEIKAMGMIFKMFFIATQLYFASIALIKLSVVAVYFEFFAGLRYRRTLWALAFLVAGWWLAFALHSVFICRPISTLWETEPQPGHQCYGDAAAAYVVNGALNVGTDAALVLLPVRVVWTMQLSGTTRLALTFVFLLGAFVCVASSVRLGISVSTSGYFIDDYPWALTQIELWSIIELCVAIVCASLLASRPLFAWLLPRRVTAWLASRVRSCPSRHTPRYGPLARALRGSKHASAGGNGTRSGTGSGSSGAWLNMHQKGTGAMTEVRRGSNARTRSDADDVLVRPSVGHNKDPSIKVTRTFAVSEDLEVGSSEMRELANGGEASSCNASISDLCSDRSGR